MQREITIRGEMIRLGQLLKLAGVVDSGAEIKGFLASQAVLVNGDRESRRGRQLHRGDVVQVGDEDLRLS
jgi:ribosome-associated protein